jgi:hypothetical protein
MTAAATTRAKRERMTTFQPRPQPTPSTVARWRRTSTHSSFLVACLEGEDQDATTPNTEYPAPAVDVKAAPFAFRICSADLGLDPDTGRRAGWQLRNDVVVPVVARRLPQIVQGDSMKTQENSLQLSVQARPHPAHIDPL